MANYVSLRDGNLIFPKHLLFWWGFSVMVVKRGLGGASQSRIHIVAISLFGIDTLSSRKV